MKINTASIVKKALGKEYQVTIEMLPEKRVRVSCKSHNGRGDQNRKSFVFPKYILVDETCIEGIALYLGDGDYHRKEKRHTTFTSKDKDIAKHFLEFLRKYLLVRDEDITFILKYKTENSHLRKEWGKTLKINPEKFLVYSTERNKEETCNIQVNGKIFRKVFEELISEIISSNLLKEKSFRRAFLRGIFAAEGSIGIDREKKPYIVQMAFSTSIKETTLHKIIQTILDQEGVRYRTDYGQKDHSCDIVITSWKYYLKLGDMNIFRICQRKNSLFEQIAKDLEVYIELKPLFRAEFFKSMNLQQKEIAKRINSWQGNVSKTQKGIILLRLEQIETLLPYSTFSKGVLIKNIEHLRIGSLTKIKPHSTMLNFLKRFKSF